jgi:hypothetical protein
MSGFYAVCTCRVERVKERQAAGRRSFRHCDSNSEGVGERSCALSRFCHVHRAGVHGDPVIADAIRDRLEHAALTVNITGESYHGVKARKLAVKNKDA